ncbi:MAG: hypothetical protein ACD_3C00013G0014 [uncultured bacterium (gcode 4)]|uniref:Uncharacterized protein n=1 Tax=uncultured bacterium (gcode 4) TaxID=1234023 RepID=K2FCK2_9BACT|nr:MAG: hypothetical protein ACD_3C00013G0014 [uncultured bacterium (gcode 4)]
MNKSSYVKKYFILFHFDKICIRNKVINNNKHVKTEEMKLRNR